MLISNYSMNKKTTLKVSKETHDLVLKAKKKLKKVFENFTLDVNIDNDFIVKHGTEKILSQTNEETIGGIKWKPKK
jgi:hypothetical protein